MPAGRTSLSIALTLALLAPGHWCCVVAAMLPTNDTSTARCCGEIPAAAEAACPHCVGQAEPETLDGFGPGTRPAKGCCEAADLAVVRNESQASEPGAAFASFELSTIAPSLVTAQSSPANLPPLWISGNRQARLCCWRC